MSGINVNTFEQQACCLPPNLIHAQIPRLQLARLDLSARDKAAAAALLGRRVRDVTVAAVIKHRAQLKQRRTPRSVRVAVQVEDQYDLT